MFQNHGKPNLIAIRPCLFLFVCIILLILCTFFILTAQILGFCLTLVSFVGLVLYCAFKKKYILCLIMLGLSLFASLYFFVDFKLFTNAKLDESPKYVIVGRADELTANSGYGFTRILENCTIYLNGDVVAKNKKVKLFLTECDIECGDVITFTSKIKNFDYFTNVGLTSEACKGVNYSASISYSKIENLSKSSTSLREKIKLRAFNIFENGMSEQGSALAYAVLFGDKSYLDFDARNAFTESGMAHILAVSGLHASMIFGLLMLILKRVKIKYQYKLLVVGSFIIFFTYLCDFTPSIVRASIMAIILALTYLRQTKYDMLNILGLAGAVILIFSPLQVFNVGFVLSFTCMFSMGLWANFSHKFTNVIINKQIYSLLVASTATSIGTLPCMAFYFGNFSLVSVITNVILLPIFTLTYSILFVIVTLCLILPIPFLLTCVDAVLLTVLDLAKFFTFWEYDYIKILKLGLVGLIISFALFYVASQKFNMKNKFKIPLTILLCLTVTGCAIYSSTPKLKGNMVIGLEGEKNNCVVSNNEIALVNSFANSTNIRLTKDFLRENQTYELDSLFILTFDFVNQNTIESFKNEFSIKTFYVTNRVKNKFGVYFELFENTKVVLLQNDTEYYCGEIVLRFNEYGENGFSITFEMQEGESMCFYS